MKPLGRKHCKSPNSKHKCKEKGKHIESWWENIIHPNKTFDKALAEQEINKEVSGLYDDVTTCFPEIIRAHPLDKVQVLYNASESEYCIYVNGNWSGYVEI